jgi:hypothetical protein
MRFVGLDLGTSFIKGAVLDLDALAIQHPARVPFPEPIRGLDPAFCEFDPVKMMAVTARALPNGVVAVIPRPSNSPPRPRARGTPNGPSGVRSSAFRRRTHPKALAPSPDCVKAELSLRWRTPLHLPANTIMLTAELWPVSHAWKS